MTFATVVLVLIKILVVIGFLMTMAALLGWADRRQSAMVQDRVGPNRALVLVPSNPLRVVVFAITALVAAAIAIPLWRPAPGLELARVTTGIQIAVLVGWFSLMLLSAHVRSRGADNSIDRLVAQLDPRTYFYGGLVTHLLTLPLVRVLPLASAEVGGAQWSTGLAGEIAAITIMSAGFYAAAKLPDGHTPIRLAGVLHAVADALKLVWKEDLRPKNADKVLFALAPLLALFPTLVTFAVVPFGSTLCFRDVNANAALDFGDLGALTETVGRSGQCLAGELPVYLSIGQLNVGLLFVFAIAGTGIIGAAIAGWSSDNKFALLGGLRATSQMVSYEVALGLAITGVLMVVGSLQLSEIVEWQGANTWGIFAQPAAFFLFWAAVIAETKRVPFDQPEGESEIVAGYFVEYSGMKFGIFLVGEYIEFAFASALIVTLFLGGYHLPFLHADGLHIAFGDNVLFDMKMSHLAVSVLHVLAFFGKTILFTWFHVFIRWTLPRFRYDQLMRLGWKVLLPLSLANIVVTGVVLLAIDGAGPAVASALQLAADITQALVAIGMLVGAVALVTWLLEPPSRKRVVVSTSARYAAAAGGVKPTEMQA